MSSLRAGAASSCCRFSYTPSTPQALENPPGGVNPELICRRTNRCCLVLTGQVCCCYHVVSKGGGSIDLIRMKAKEERILGGPGGGSGNGAPRNKMPETEA